MDSYLNSKSLESKKPSNIAKPSIGHIATPNSMTASQWGNVYSVWPLDHMSYIWLKVLALRLKLFYKYIDRLI